MNRVIKSVTSETMTSGPSVGGRHAEVMEQRRLQRSISTAERSSPSAGERSPSQALVSRDQMTDELQQMNQKLDAVASQVARCLEDTSSLRFSFGLQSGGPGAAASPSSPSLPVPSPEKRPRKRPSPQVPQPPHFDSSWCVEPQVEAKDSGLSFHLPEPEDSDVRLASVCQNADVMPPISDQLEREFKPSDNVLQAVVKMYASEGARGAVVMQKSRSLELRASSIKWDTTPHAPAQDGLLGSDVTSAVSRVRQRDARTQKIWSFLENPGTVTGSRLFARLVSLMIVVSSVMTFLQTMDDPVIDRDQWVILELFFDFIFTLEVATRWFVCPNRINFVRNAYNIIDIIAVTAVLTRSIFAYSVEQAEATGSTILLSLSCAVPILRLLKLLRRFDTFHLITKAFRLASEALPVLLFILSILVLVFASLIYIVEPRSNIDSLPTALWFTIVTVGTIGYGDITPVSSMGVLVVSGLIVVSALYMAIPIGIVGKAFSQVWDDRDVFLLNHRTRARFLEQGYKACDVPIMFCSFDHNGDGELDFQEFADMMEHMQIDIGGDRLLDLFSSFDCDGSGAIDDREFVRTLFPSAYAEIYGRIEVEPTAQAGAESAAEASPPIMHDPTTGCSAPSFALEPYGSTPRPSAPETPRSPGSPWSPSDSPKRQSSFPFTR
mmetsp:Transcript_130840/g.418696  ORF Transcript_130840/g.418696 Transcript_130840/m.418696 type:complete len:665 (-) Transcript_130840:44-2038(-)